MLVGGYRHSDGSAHSNFYILNTFQLYYSDLIKKDKSAGSQKIKYIRLESFTFHQINENTHQGFAEPNYILENKDQSWIADLEVFCGEPLLFYSPVYLSNLLT